MRLIVPVGFSTPGGVERVILSVLSTIPDHVEQVILVIPKNKIKYFQEQLPESTIIFELLDWEEKSLESYYLRLLDNLSDYVSRLKIYPVKQFLKKLRGYVRLQARLQHLVQKHCATHGLYFITNRLPIPQLNIPVGMVCHDVFWRFAPLSYPEDYQRAYDESLLSWLEYSSTVIAVSERTRQDVLEVFPDFNQKVVVVPNSGFRVGKNDDKSTVEKVDDANLLLTQLPFVKEDFLFYFPSSFSLYKDHLSLLQASLALTQYNQRFKVILTGKETDKLVKGDFNLQRQSKTEEYSIYLHKIQTLYLNKAEFLENYFIGLGYCDESTVEVCYQACHCVVIPSTYEGFGLALSEAIVRGLPVICSDLDVFQEQIQLYQCEDRVLVYPKGNPEALMECMRKFLAAPIPRLDANQVDERFGHWTWSDVSKHYVECLLRKR